jgi:hypothetical protein
MHNKGSKNLIITPRTLEIIRFFSNWDGTAMEEKNRPGSWVLGFKNIVLVLPKKRKCPDAMILQLFDFCNPAWTMGPKASAGDAN